MTIKMPLQSRKTVIQPDDHSVDPGVKVVRVVWVIVDNRLRFRWFLPLASGSADKCNLLQ